MSAMNPIREFNIDPALEIWLWPDGVRIGCRTFNERRKIDYVQYDDISDYRKVTEMRLDYMDKGKITYRLDCADLMGFKASYQYDGQRIHLQEQQAFVYSGSTPIVTYHWHTPLAGKMVCHDPVIGDMEKKFFANEEDVVYEFPDGVTSFVSKDMDASAIVTQRIVMPGHRNFLLQFSTQNMQDKYYPVATMAMYTDEGDKTIAATFNQDSPVFLRNTKLEQGLKLCYS